MIHVSFFVLPICVFEIVHVASLSIPMHEMYAAVSCSYNAYVVPLCWEMKEGVLER